VIELPVPSLTYGLDMFERLVIEQPCIDRFRTHDHPAIRLAGELLDRRAGHSEPEHNEVGQNKVGLLGDAGALVLMTNPELFVIDELLVHIELEGAKRGQAVVARGPTVHERPQVSVAVDLDVTKAASAFVETINGYAA
jgi:pyrimidine-specific ribonucleoside hydrolase